MALTAELGSLFIVNAEMDAAAAATYDLNNPVGVAQQLTGDTAFEVVMVSIQWVAADAASSGSLANLRGFGTSTVQLANVDSAGTVTNMFATAVQCATSGNAANVVFAVPDNSVATSAIFSGADKLRIVTVDAETQIKIRFYCRAGTQTSLTVS